MCHLRGSTLDERQRMVLWFVVWAKRFKREMSLAISPLSVLTRDSSDYYQLLGLSS